MLLALGISAIQEVQAQDQLSVTFSVINEDDYNIVTGTVTNSNQEPVEGATTSIQVNDASGNAVHFKMIHTDQSGAFTDKFKVPEGVEGECTVYITASKSGYDAGIVQANFTAVPEFSTLLPLAVTASLFLASALHKRKSK